MKLLRNSALVLSVLACLAGVFSCNKDNKGGSDIPDGITIADKFLNEGVSFTKAGGEVTISVQSKNDVGATPSASWITISKGSTSPALSVTPFTLSVAANTETADRSANVTFSDGKDSKVVKVTQEAVGGLVIKTQSFDVSAEGGEISVQLSANVDYSFEIGASWITSASTRASMADYTEKFTVAKNVASVKRSGTITFKIDGKSETVTVNQAAGESSGGAGKTASEIAEAMYPGWNLGNTMEGGSNSNSWKNIGISSETSWQSTKTTQEIISLVKASGFRSVRIPCAWVMGHITDAENCTIDTEWMNRVKEVVGYCLNEGLYVIVNQHWDGGWMEHDGFTENADVDAKKAQLTKIWTQIATEFKEYDEHLLFGGLNEPGVGGKYTDGSSLVSVAKMSERLAVYEQAFIDAVRATGGNNATRVLIVQGPNTNIDNFCDNNYMSKISDSVSDRLMVEVHFYDPYQFTMMSEDASWGKMYYYWGKGNKGSDSSRVCPDKSAEEYVEAQMKKMRTNFVDKGYPVLVGEFGANQRFASGKDSVHDASIKAYYKAVTQYSIENGCVPVAWDTNYTSYPSMTIFGRAACKVFNDNMLSGIQDAASSSTWMK